MTSKKPHGHKHKPEDLEQKKVELERLRDAQRHQSADPTDPENQARAMEISKLEGEIAEAEDDGDSDKDAD